MTAQATPTLGDIGARVDLLIRQGAAFGPHRLELANPDATPLDLTGCTLHAQLRRTPSSTEVLAAFTCAIADAAQGWADIGLDAAATAALQCGDSPRDPESRAHWSLDVHDSAGRPLPLLWGEATIFRSVTRP